MSGIIELLADVFVPCEACMGTRFEPEVLDAHRGVVGAHGLERTVVLGSVGVALRHLPPRPRVDLDRRQLREPGRGLLGETGPGER